MDAMPSDLLRFGSFDLDLETGELRRSGIRLRLQPQPLKVLETLVLRAGELVTREELHRAVWGDGTFVDFDHGLNFCVNQVRRVLGDRAASARFVETVPRRGYRFVAPVLRVARSARPSSELEDAPAGERERPHARWPVLPLAVVMVLGLCVSASGLRPSPAPPREPGLVARTAYLRGVYHAQRDFSEWPEAVRWLERAVVEEPGYAPAQAALARAYVQLAEARLRPGRDVFPLVRSAALAAVGADASAAEGHVWLGIARLHNGWDWDEADRELRKAIALAPDLALARRRYAAFLSARGDQGGALGQMEVARRLDPLCPVITGEAALLHYRARRFEEAAALWRAGLGVRDDSGGHEALFSLYLKQGRVDSAAFEALQVMSRVGVPEGTIRSLSVRPPPEIVRAFLQGAIAQLDRPDSTALPDRVALLYATLGERGRALDRLEAAWSERSPSLPGALRDPGFDDLRDEPRFQRIVAAVGLS
jgi:DNA-binding winged helix-turn-helix (wHTH) protein/tetratricopeptide (TPR) repeat protein